MRIHSAVLLLLAVSAMAQGSGSDRQNWNRPERPFRIIGNIYYVGAAGVSSFLIKTPEGGILLDGGLVETAPQIERNIAALGFSLRDVEYLLNSHAHYDHCGGLAELKRATGAKLIISAPDAGTISSGHQLSYGRGQSDSRFPAAKVDSTIADGATVSLGGTTLTAHVTPGHTRGCTTWSGTVSDHGANYQVVFYCSTSVAGNDLVDNRKYPEIIADYQRSFAMLEKLPCDVFLGAHPSFFDLREKRRRLEAGQWDAFVDPQELKRFVASSRREFDQELARQKAAATPSEARP